MRLLTLPAILRAAGLTVHEVDGWRSRGSSAWGPLRGITCHHTGGSRSSTDAGEIRTLLHGSTSAPAPIAQLYLSRSGAWWVVASGMCFHNLTGWAGPNRGLGNGSLLGVEAQHSGGSEPWTDVQYRSYVAGVAALCRALDLPVSRVAGHKEHQPGAKSDPTFDMPRFRADVAAALRTGEDQEDDMADASTIKAIAQASAAAVHNQRVGSSQRTIGMQLQGAAQAEQLAEVTAKLDALIRAQAGQAGDAILAEIRAQGEQTRAALLAAVVERAPELAAAVAAQLGDQVAVDELAEAFTRALAVELAD